MNSKAIVFAILVAGLIIAVAIYSTQNASLLPRFLDPHGEVIQAIEEKLYDSSSAQYKNWKESSLGYCVEINAKNQYGAYTGFKKVHAMKVTNERGKYTISDSDAVVAIFCKE